MKKIRKLILLNLILIISVSCTSLKEGLTNQKKKSTDEFFVEKKSIGNVHSQDWEFYAVTFFLFLVFSFPGFIYKVIWK